jgi:putative membrane protein
VLDFLWMASGALSGTLIAAAVSCLPGLHIYNVMGGFLLIAASGSLSGAVPFEAMIPFLTALIVGWSMLNTIPSILLGAPDESAMFTVLPGQKYLMTGRGYAGVMMTGVGGLAAVWFLVLITAPTAPFVLPVLRGVLSPHLHWILWVIITFMLMSEWPKSGHTGPSGWRKFFDAWGSLGAGLLTFILSGLFGFLLLYRSPVSLDAAFQNIMPAFVGLFAVPWCLLNVLSGTEIPAQTVEDSLPADGDCVLRSLGAGAVGGHFAAFLPAVTGGVGGMLAGHATAQRDERVFIMSQGASKLFYYAGAFLLFFVPGMSLRRGGGAWMVQSLYTPRTLSDYLMVIGSIAVAGGLSFLLLGPLTRAVLWSIRRVNYRVASIAALAIIVAMVAVITGGAGLFVMAVGAGIGTIPVLFGSRRLNCLGVLLLPMACNLSGIGSAIARFLRLI